MARAPKDPNHPARVAAATRLTFQQDVILTQLEHRFGYTRSQLLRMAIQPLLAAASKTSPDQFERALLKKVFNSQIGEIDVEHEAIVLTDIARNLDNNGRYNPDNNNKG